MATGASYPAAASPVVVVAPHFCVGHPVDLTIVRKMMTLSEGTFGVTDVDGNLMFKAQGKIFSLHDRRVLLDAAGTPLITYKEKLMSAHRRWEVFRGESTDEKDMLFSVRKSSLFQMKTKLHVFMASNTSEDICDFRIEGNWFESKCAIYAGNSNNIIAQMHRNHSAKSILLGKDNFGVTVYPNVDYAFIVSLVVILEEINTDRNES
ncbi:hypothetical protein ABFS82_10G007600 [Erythranthe guttata]|uniref:Protein LURP-one-related 15 n=1 Tax=Erythranthe guttata TaxID=4155 RepID=A0A022RQF9_ERYGU|nr:PREDICTED: protein LURP-one-related 15-like [Erythranthe guttata]EYU41983.1 hypothetical protein MIMGU_mgv11b011599mg [Erythranthe guttata]|eukprot:XP_012832241.1 PREDICTED: protein LURP-one-related 15-like [Erythranthe guttata]